MKRFALAVLGAVLSAGYWWGVVTFADGVGGGDPGPAAPPRSEAAQNAVTLSIFVVAVLVYAALSLLWRRIEARFL